jgi:hypothetical protein
MSTAHQQLDGASMRERNWPALRLAAWRDTCVALHLQAQIIGKIRLALTPKTNQWWNVPLYVTARGLTTSPMPLPDRSFSIDLDFIDDEVVISDSDGRRRALPLIERSIADFQRELFEVLGAMGIHVPIWPHPVEMPYTTPFPQQTEARPYDAVHAHRFWRILRTIEPIFERHRAGFRGKSSPVHLFWGSFDLAVTRFSGRRAPARGPSLIERDSYDEECISLGFWPGDEWGAVPGDPPLDASFYAYAVPEPPGFAAARVRPAEARYDPRLREFVLPYEAVRRAPDPASTLLSFAQTTYEAGARLGGWNVRDLAYP